MCALKHFWAFDFFSDGTYSVNVTVNDTSNAITSMAWAVDVANVVNRLWTVDYVLPTPANGTNLSSMTVNVSVEIKPAILKKL